MAESYRRWRLPELWEMVAADDAADAHLHLATLRRQQTALETQRDRLRVLRDQLAEAWPPEKSEAATAFLQQLNDMIDAFTVTARGSAEVRSGLQVIADAISHAREQLAPLVERYTKAQSLPDPRVGRHTQKLLDQDARQILMAADVTVRDATAKFAVSLPDYSRISTQTSIPPVNGGTTTTAGGTPSGSGTKSASARLNGFSSPRFEPPAAVVNDLIGEDVVLAQSQAGTINHGWPLGSPGTVQSDGVSAKGYPQPIPSVGRVIGIGPSSGMNVTGADGLVRGVGAGSMRGVPGGMIGGTPVTSSAGSAGGRLLHAPPALSRSTPSMSRSTSPASGYQDRSFEDYVARRREPDDERGDQWTVNQGVRPLLEALPPSRTHDPGPGVIGLDR
jgi:hypothetical protein